MPTLSGEIFDPTASPLLPPECLPRAWWFGDFAQGTTHFRGIEATLVRLRHILETQGPFDGVWGFSQGGACAAVLASLVADPGQHPTFAAPGPGWPPPPLRFVVIVSGFVPLDPTCQALFARKVDTPSLLVLGKGDTVAGHGKPPSPHTRPLCRPPSPSQVLIPDAAFPMPGPDRSLQLLDGFTNLRVEWHEGGHHVPTKPSWRRFFEAYVTSPDSSAGGLAAVPGPAAHGRAVDARAAKQAEGAGGTPQGRAATGPVF